MMDMLMETLGAIVTCLALWFDKGRTPLIQDEHKIYERAKYIVGKPLVYKSIKEEEFDYSF